jgi:hypothetical protein
MLKIMALIFILDIAFDDIKKNPYTPELKFGLKAKTR